MDLDGLFKRAFDGFGELPEPSGFPGVPGRDEASGNSQPIAEADISRVSRVSRSGNRVLGSDQNPTPKNKSDSPADDRAREDLFKTPGNPGNPGKEVKTLAETDTSLFPERESVPGNPGKISALSGHTILDLNRAAPQRSDWWTGPAMAEAARLAPPAEPPPISPVEVRAGVERELRGLAEIGREGPAALRDAVEITRAKIRNSEVLAERQVRPGRCHVCNDPLDDSAPVVAVLSWSRGSALHLHAGCHEGYRARRIALVDRIMATAGYSTEETKLCV